ncbi:dethiobiotin synthase [Thalassospira xiamenensis]|nr:dethiobiotin synthase [Thalassospira xiamenensis]
MRSYFIAGTDTDVGKTLVAAAIIYGLKQHLASVTAMKPVAAGCDTTHDPEESLVNIDALQLKALVDPDIPYAYVNPKAYAEPIAPHIAAARAQDPISVSALLEAYRTYQQDFPADAMVIEGAGGWQLPLSDHETMPQFVAQSGAQVVLVVGLKLGCLNHALLTVNAIQAAGLKLCGWVGNRITAAPMAYEAENIAYLKQAIEAPCLGLLPYVEDLANHTPSADDEAKLFSATQLQSLSQLLNLKSLL